MIFPSSSPPDTPYDAAREGRPGEGIHEATGCATLTLGFFTLGIVGALQDGVLPDAPRMLRPLIFLALTLIAGTTWWVVRRARDRRRARRAGLPVPPWRGAVLLLVCIPCFLFFSYAGMRQARIRAAAAMPKQWPALVHGGVSMSLVTRLHGDSVSYRLTAHCAAAQACPSDWGPGALVTLFGPEGMERELWLTAPERRRDGVVVASGRSRMAFSRRSEYLAATCWTVEMRPSALPQDRSPGCAPPRP